MEVVKSRIYTKEFCTNTNREFGENLGYFVVYLETPEGVLTPLMFTEDQIEVAQDRAEDNPEDIPPAKLPFVQRMFSWILGEYIH